MIVRSRKPLVYIASPYTRGDSAVNTRFSMLVFDRMLTDNIVQPYSPLWNHIQHLCFPRPPEDWINYDLDLIRRGVFDAVVRLCASEARLEDYLQTESAGADGEVAVAEKLGIPVFYAIPELYEWAATEKYPEH